MSTTEIPTPRHQANIVAKARRGIDALNSLIQWRLVSAVDFPDINNMREGRAYMLAVLTEDPTSAEAGAWWVAIGVEHDRLKGRTKYRAGQFPTLFNTSRETFLHMLDAQVWADNQPEPVDPFDGLAF